MDREKNTCCLCGRKFDGFGHNPDPLHSDDESRCCDSCNTWKVIPARTIISELEYRTYEIAPYGIAESISECIRDGVKEVFERVSVTV